MRQLAAVCLTVCLLLACRSEKQEAVTGVAGAPVTTAGGEVAASRPAAEVPPGALFNGRDLTGWTCDLDDPKVKMEDVWSVADGVLACKGRPAGVLRTKREDFADYMLTLEWRWLPESGGGNNGVLVHASTPRTLGIWPKSFEVQLQADHAGDFWIIGTSLEVPNAAERRQGRRYLNLTEGSEHSIGEWNQMEITCRGNEILVKVNGELVNHATNCSESRGAICLQSEGTPIQYRKIRLNPL